ncbi:CG9300 [Drosophila busckii]|uniref:CG9300 n=1 Tax=Drosophila busckii TaxID=30019 RepID=A0A0M4EKM6_DROBS|nr:uncharacterized protein LOC108600186 [Drosophila busckii]ALC44764.1 CG9300 [Drosophila busckii]
MSKFLSYYNLFPIPDPKEFLGMAADKKDGNVITTLARNVVVVLNISTHKQVYSWSMPEKLSTKVIFDQNSQKYVAVFGNHAIRLWDTDTSDVAKCKKLKFQKSIAHMVHTDKEAIVLYSDGTSETLSQALESRKDQKEDTAEQLALAASKTMSKPTVHKLANGQELLTYFEERHATGELQLIRHPLDNSKIRSYAIKREAVRLAGYAVIEGDAAPQLLTIWSDKRIFMLNLAERTHELAPGQFVSMLAELNVESKLSVHGLSRNFAAIYGANYGQEGASLLVYNTLFKVVNAKQYFKVYLDFSRLWARDDHILLAMGQNIAAVRYCTNDELLVDMLGSQVHNTQLTPIELDHINEEEALEAVLKYGGSRTEHKPMTKGKLANKPVKNLPPANGKTVAFDSPEISQQELDELVKTHVSGEILHVDNGLEDVQITLMGNYFDEGPQNLAVQSVMRQLERSGAGEQEITEKLLTLFIKTKDSQHVLMCLRRYTNISEHMLAWCLRFALDTSTTALTNGDAKDKDRATPETDELLNAVLACTFNSEAIEKHLKKQLELPHVLRLLKHLYVVATVPDVLLEERPDHNNVTFGNTCTELQAMQWLSALLTSHITLLTICKDKELQTILKKWSEHFKLYAELLKPLAMVVPLLTNIITRHQPKRPYSTMWYNIEKVKLY